VSSAGQQEAYGPEAQTADIHERADALNVELFDIWTFQAKRNALGFDDAH
jgi:hypothetical protein